MPFTAATAMCRASSGYSDGRTALSQNFFGERTRLIINVEHPKRRNRFQPMPRLFGVAATCFLKDESRNEGFVM